MPICISLYMWQNRLTSEMVGYVDTALSSDYRRYCHAVSSARYYQNSSFGSTLIATRVYMISDFADYNQVNVDINRVYELGSTASQLGCYASKNPVANAPGFGTIIEFLPQSPDQVRIPTIISKMSGDGSLAGNFAIELFSGIWQYLSILLGFKIFKFVRGS